MTTKQTPQEGMRALHLMGRPKPGWVSDDDWAAAAPPVLARYRCKGCGTAYTEPNAACACFEGHKPPKKGGKR